MPNPTISSLTLPVKNPSTGEVTNVTYDLPSGGGSGGGHTIENSAGTDLTQRDTLKFGAGFSATDDSTNEKTVIAPDTMTSSDMEDIFDTLPDGREIKARGFEPLGTIIAYYGETAPRFYLACDGATYNKSDYPELAAHLLSLTTHSQYEVSGDSTKFKVPDLRGEFLRGTGTNSHANQGNGASVGVHQDGTVESANYYDGASLCLTGGGPSQVDSVLTSTADRGYISVSGSDKVGARYTSRPANTSVLYCIAYKDIYTNPMNDYSTTEKVVGTWIDGKPIYQRTFSGTTPSSSSSADFASLNDLNIDDIISVSGYLIKPETSTNNTYRYANTLGWNVWANRTAIRQSQSDSSYQLLTAYVTIQYTKTTD